MYATAALVKRGRTYDIEDSRTTNRMHAMLAVLRAMGVEPTITHGTRTYFDWAMAGSLNPDKHLCALQGAGGNDCTISWPEWVTDEHFDQAYEWVDRLMTAQGEYNRSEAARHYESRALATQGERHDKCGRMVAYGELHWTDQC